MNDDARSTSSRSALRIRSIERPGWEPPDGRTPRVGERVFSLEGPGKVARVLGRTGDGSRLLELELDDRPKPPFFAATSNVLVRVETPPEAEPGPEPSPEPTAETVVRDRGDIWFGPRAAQSAPWLRAED